MYHSHIKWAKVNGGHSTANDGCAVAHPSHPVPTPDKHCTTADACAHTYTSRDSIGRTLYTRLQHLRCSAIHGHILMKLSITALHCRGVFIAKAIEYM